MERQRILVLIGPTAVGKTELSLALAEELQAEIISADSMQVYRGMDIGTAKPSPEQRRRVPHHLLDVVDPDESFNVADYVDMAEAVLCDLKARQVVPLLTGGTGLYCRWFLCSQAGLAYTLTLSLTAFCSLMPLRTRRSDVSSKNKRCRIHSACTGSSRRSTHSVLPGFIPTICGGSSVPWRYTGGRGKPSAPCSRSGNSTSTDIDLSM